MGKRVAELLAKIDEKIRMAKRTATT